MSAFGGSLCSPSRAAIISGIGRGGTGVLKVDGKEVARQSMDHTMPLIVEWDENFDIGADTGTPVCDDYQVPFKFTGTLDKLTLRIDRPELSAADIEKLKEATCNNKAAE
jgi:arylsulfatase